MNWDIFSFALISFRILVTRSNKFSTMTAIMSSDQNLVNAFKSYFNFFFKFTTLLYSIFTQKKGGLKLSLCSVEIFSGWNTLISVLKLGTTPCLTHLHYVLISGWRIALPTLSSTNTSSQAPLPSPPQPTFSWQMPLAPLLWESWLPAWWEEVRLDTLVWGKKVTWLNSRSQHNRADYIHVGTLCTAAC